MFHKIYKQNIRQYGGFELSKLCGQQFITLKVFQIPKCIKYTPNNNLEPKVILNEIRDLKKSDVEFSMILNELKYIISNLECKY